MQARSLQLTGFYLITWQALEKWGNWGQPGGPALSNGQSEIKFTKLEFKRPRSIANQYGPDDGYTGALPRSASRDSSGIAWRAGA